MARHIPEFWPARTRASSRIHPADLTGPWRSVRLKTASAAALTKCREAEDNLRKAMTDGGWLT